MADISQEQMDAIWSALNAPLRPSRSFSYRSILQRVLKEGWLYSYQLEDLVMEAESRLDELRHRIELKDLAEALGYQWTHITSRPRVTSNAVGYSSALRASEAASLLMDLERLGFQFDPQPLVDALRPALLKQAILTDAELDIFWAPKIRGKSEISLEVKDGEFSFREYREGKFANGYRFVALIRKDGSLHSLSVRGPGHRRRKDPVETVCNECGSTWWRGDPDSSAGHRREHKRRMHILDPQPHELMIAAALTDSDPELVTSQSPAWKHDEIYRRAYAFKREEKYDFVQWQSSSGDDDPKAHGFLFIDEAGIIKGAGAFRWREPEAPEAPFWGLQWVWICPRYRRQGILESRWKKLRERFGDFVVEGPVSQSMRAFLAKHGDTELMRWPSSRGKIDENAEPLA